MANKNFLDTQAVRSGDWLRKLLEFMGLPILQPQPVKIFEKRQRIITASRQRKI